MRMNGETVIAGSHDWTVRVRPLARRTSDVVLACHVGPIPCVEYSPLDKGIMMTIAYFLKCVGLPNYVHAQVFDP